MTSVFLVTTTSHFDREIKKLSAKHASLLKIFQSVFATLQPAPYNRSRQFSIKKLEAVSANDGQYRIRVGRFRFRYDIDGQTVYLKTCSLRREDTYK